ncbi:hypothetical protein ES692_05070 [Psychroserpens burtonensis]|uniref:Uncharacterized protein n=1 Tax=Psychroserpens burtonensis TaxID=49278 RepID=A0A5C7BGX8_9FLAO|nr:DUF6695 family protein [Psychroserpens burtonensis]TXE18825.1 hypothetical protein ES692_05070 [Psychroserpens burtonensis]
MNDGIIIILAYPETIVSHAEEWYSKFLSFFFIGNRKHVRAGHAALVLVNKSTGVLEYHDFGRYIAPVPSGRLRGKETDFELRFPISAEIKDNRIVNLDEILKFLATHPTLTHGNGNMYASVCDVINYKKARGYIESIQNQGFIRYAAFVKDACNCARFVTNVLIASVTNTSIKSKLIKSKGFTPSTVGNVVIADTANYVYIVSDIGKISKFNSTVSRLNRQMFLDTLKGHDRGLTGNLEPAHNHVKGDQAQWLGGIGVGAWFEVYNLDSKTEYRFRRISPDGHVHCDGIYKLTSEGFDYNSNYKFLHYSNCKFFQIKQNETTYRFEYLKNFDLDRE